MAEPVSAIEAGWYMSILVTTTLTTLPTKVALVNTSPATADNPPSSAATTPRRRQCIRATKRARMGSCRISPIDGPRGTDIQSRLQRDRVTCSAYRWKSTSISRADPTLSLSTAQANSSNSAPERKCAVASRRQLEPSTSFRSLETSCRTSSRKRVCTTCPLRRPTMARKTCRCSYRCSSSPPTKRNLANGPQSSLLGSCWSASRRWSKPLARSSSLFRKCA